MKTITWEGKTQSVRAWADEIGVTPQTIYCRIKRHKGDLVKVFAEQTGPLKFEYEGHMYNAEQLAAINGTVTGGTILRWIRDDGLTPAEAVRRTSSRLSREKKVPSGKKRRPVGCCEPDCENCPFPDDCHW